MALSEEYYNLYDKILSGVENWDYSDLERLLELSNQDTEKEIKQKATDAFRQCCNHRSNDCDNNCSSCGAYEAFVAKINI